jgi:hypothetical protein
MVCILAVRRDLKHQRMKRANIGLVILNDVGKLTTAAFAADQPVEVSLVRAYLFKTNLDPAPTLRLTHYRKLPERVIATNEVDFLLMLLLEHEVSSLWKFVQR